MLVVSSPCNVPLNDHAQVLPHRRRCDCPLRWRQCPAPHEYPVNFISCSCNVLLMLIPAPVSSNANPNSSLGLAVPVSSVILCTMLSLSTAPAPYYLVRLSNSIPNHVVISPCVPNMHPETEVCCQTSRLRHLPHLFLLSLLPGNQPNANPLMDFGKQNGTSLTWIVNQPSGTAAFY